MWGVFDLTASAWLRKCNWILSSWSFLVQNLGGLCSSYNELWHLRFGLPYSFKVRWLPHSSLLTQECYHSSCVQDKSERWIVQTDGLKQSQVITMIVLDVQCICILWAAILSCYFDVLYHLYLQLTEVQLGIFKERWLFFVFLFFFLLTYAETASSYGRTGTASEESLLSCVEACACSRRRINLYWV